MNNTGEIIEKKEISHDTIFLRLKFQCPIFADSEISFFVYIYDDSGVNKKPYTPVTWTEEEVCFIIKIYKGQGISEFINSKLIGDNLSVSQPLPKLRYNGNYNKILMICGGTGITPMLQILKHENDMEKFTIISCNKTYKDIIINRDIIDRNLDMYHILSREDQDCDTDEDMYFINKQNVIKTRFNKEILEDITKAKGVEKFDFVYVCGPPGFMKDVSGPKTPDFQQGEVEGILRSLGYNGSNVYKF